MYKKVFRTILALSLVTSLFLAGCGQEKTAINGDNHSASGGKVVLTFWDENAGPQRTPIYEELIKRFEAQNPNIDIQYVGLPKNSAKQKYDAAIAANDMPDVAGVQTSWLPEFSIRGALLPLDDYFNQWSEKGKINEPTIDFNRNIVVDKKLYGIPYTQNLDILWYRPDWFKESGVKPLETWDEFFTAVEKMTDKGKNRYGFSIRGGAGGSFQLQRMMYAYSGIDKYFDKSGKSTINDPKHVEFVKKYLGLYKKYTPESDITNGYKEMVAGFDTGAVALVQHNIGSYGEHSKALKPEQFAALPLPKTADGKYVAEGGNSINFSIFKTTRHPKEAWKFVSFMTSAESQSYWNQNTGQIPTHADVLNEKWVKDAQHIQTAFKVLEDPNMVFYNPAFYLPDYRSILDNVVDPGIQAVMSGKKSVEDFLNEWAGAMEKSKQQYDAHFKK
ncbi:ABC transporter substrate-binding protein [Paenactinomyces guangxiensis]|uniref:Extracellular solute-binding protein n=1 Tax=Paenactinomyces guangxiensis TaxID=1490290 RepID=A0A7W1WP40_9BACL|nr:sugar ABC transporter substrate-binding protein [Paenactinomyces guangxiensis]MBA4493348.1 extracellular solute-binding protein [Paenactinomyces guangxiensis]MBH8593426.1 extracellular solute-binding protein [Paenactinomyces guangxiensis]